jgi:hypothetical protein
MKANAYRDDILEDKAACCVAQVVKVEVVVSQSGKSEPS